MSIAVPPLGGYRVSTKRQGASGLGLEAQQHAVKELVAREGMDVLAAFAEVESGTRMADRPQLRAAIAMCRREDAVLLIAKLDRLARNVHFLSGLMGAGVEFRACDMPVADNFTVHILAAVAEKEAKLISERDTSYKLMRGVLRPYKKLADDHRVALVLLHHTTTHTGQPNGGNAISGTADIMWTLQRDRNARVGRLTVTGRISESDLELGWDAEVGRWTCKTETTKLTVILKPGTLKDRVAATIDKLVGDEWVTRPDLLRDATAAINAQVEKPVGQSFLERLIDLHHTTQVERRVFERKAGKPISYRRRRQTRVTTLRG